MEKTHHMILGIAEGDRPNAGRIYDYFIGGNHNFEVDRKAADELIKYAPHIPNYLKTIRWFLGESVRRLSEQGYDKFIDFASGLPVMDHIHQITPEGTKVIYSDRDPVTVQYANEIMGEMKNVRYVVCEAGEPETLLKSGVVEELFGNDRKVAIGMNGVFYFMPDEDIVHSFRVLYDWAAEGSKLFFCNSIDDDVNNFSEDQKKFVNIYKEMRQPLFLRPLKKTIEIIKPWKIEEPGFLPLEKWLDMEVKVGKETIENWGTGDQYGVFLYK